MSRESLNDFLHAVDHSSSLRRDVRLCTTSRDLTQLARRYGFVISDHDLQLDEQTCRLQAWFDRSRINPIPSHHRDQ